jgi:hypothetical protein
MNALRTPLYKHRQKDSSPLSFLHFISPPTSVYNFVWCWHTAVTVVFSPFCVACGQSNRFHWLKYKFSPFTRKWHNVSELKWRFLQTKIERICPLQFSGLRPVCLVGWYQRFVRTCHLHLQGGSKGGDVTCWYTWASGNGGKRVKGRRIWLRCPERCSSWEKISEKAFFLGGPYE